MGKAAANLKVFAVIAVVVIVAAAIWYMMSARGSQFTNLERHSDDMFGVSFLAPAGWVSHAHADNQIELHDSSDDEHGAEARILVWRDPDEINEDWASLSPGQQATLADNVYQDIIDGNFSFNLTDPVMATYNGVPGVAADIRVENSMYPGILYGRTFIAIGPDGRMYRLAPLTTDESLTRHRGAMDEIIESWQFAQQQGENQ